MRSAPTPSEGDVNQSPSRSEWQSQHLDPGTRTLLARDSAAFLHQSVSTPCLNAIAKAQGIWIEDVAGRRYMDFHGNNVHHVGYAHPHVIGAIKDQLDALSFAPRRFASRRAVDLAEALNTRFQSLTGRAGKLLFTTGGSDAVEVAIKLARIATGRFKTLSFWGLVSRRGLRRLQRRWRITVSQRSRGRPASSRHRARGAVWLLPLPLWPRGG